MESWLCLLLLCSLSVALSSGEATKNDDDIDLVSFLRRLSPGLLVRDEPFIIDQDFEVNSQKERGHAEVLSPTQETKDKTAGQGTNRTPDPSPVVLTKDGVIKGVTVDKAHVFYGIPYADPPVGAYRWKPPRPVTPWQGVHDASFPRAACMQGCSGPISDECPQMVRKDILQPHFAIMMPHFLSFLTVWHLASHVERL